jgi:hypothetical protein
LDEKIARKDYFTVPSSKFFLLNEHHRQFLGGNSKSLRYVGSEIPIRILAVLLVFTAMFFLVVGIVDPNVQLGAILVAAIFGIMAMWVLMDMRRHHRLIYEGQLIQGEIIKSGGKWAYHYEEFLGLPGMKRSWFIRFRYRFYTPFGGAIEKSVERYFNHEPEWFPPENTPIAVIYVNENFHKLL